MGIIKVNPRYRLRSTSLTPSSISRHGDVNPTVVQYTYSGGRGRGISWQRIIWFLDTLMLVLKFFSR